MIRGRVFFGGGVAILSGAAVWVVGGLVLFFCFFWRVDGLGTVITSGVLRDMS